MNRSALLGSTRNSCLSKVLVPAEQSEQFRSKLSVKKELFRYSDTVPHHYGTVLPITVPTAPLPIRQGAERLVGTVAEYL